MRLLNRAASARPLAFFLSLSVATALSIATTPSFAQVVDDFDDDPTTSVDWELYEPEAPAEYFTDDGYFRVTIPAGVNLDTWVGADRGIQLRRADFPEDFTIETRVRIPADGVLPPPGSPFLAGLLVQFSQHDIIHWNIGQQRIIDGLTYEIWGERTDMPNLIPGGPAPGLLAGDPVRLRIEKRCSVYRFLYRIEGDPAWTDAGEYETTDPAQHVGLVMKTWGLGTAFTVDFDEFDRLEPDTTPSGSVFHRGDTNADGLLNITDGIFVLNFLFLGGPEPPCRDSADADDSESLNITDGIYLLNFLFLGGEAPPLPGPLEEPCGIDPDGTPELGCLSYPPCD